ncbi:MAG: hypothetical protein PHQ42_03285 [Patescibacteria group bacterium]|nr:hypothetical protein [Patescibacteria group bacterium]
MKNIFKKTLKFISSRLIYLVIGIFLAVGATYVYATWDQARTGGSGQLAESNWNELVNMLESEFTSLTPAQPNYNACFVKSAGDHINNNCASYPSCPAGWTSVDSWCVWEPYDSANYSIAYRACCLLR